MVTLTEKQASVLAYISEHVRRYGYAPSVTEVAKATGRSKTAAHAIAHGNDLISAARSEAQ